MTVVVPLIVCRENGLNAVGPLYLARPAHLQVHSLGDTYLLLRSSVNTFTSPEVKVKI